jgi:hypothetical protein
MAATRAQIRRAKVIGHKVDFGDGVEVTFWYDRNKITDAWMQDWQTHEQQQAAPALNEMLADLIERWDIVETEDGPEIPVSVKTIGELFGLPDKIYLMTELYTAGTPSRAEGEVSSGLSLDSPQAESADSTQQQLERPQTPQNGAEPSPSPAPSVSPSPT